MSATRAGPPARPASNRRWLLKTGVEDAVHLLEDLLLDALDPPAVAAPLLPWSGRLPDSTSRRRGGRWANGGALMLNRCCLRRHGKCGRAGQQAWTRHTADFRSALRRIWRTRLGRRRQDDDEVLRRHRPHERGGQLIGWPSACRLI
eukprot:scaffold922_cov327-Pinguiococcus_pyrenoidosus.AAC.49